MQIQTTMFKMMIRRMRPISRDGFNRLNRMAKLNFKRVVYKPLKRVVIDTDKIDDEKRLAYFLMLNFGAGKYDALAWNPHTHRFTKQLFVVEIHGSLDTKWDYEFISTRGIARRGWWIPE